MMRGGSSWSRTFSSSVRPSVWSAPRVSSGRPRGSLDHAVPLISITTCATCAPRVISQSQPCASAPVRAYLPRFALISQLTTARLGDRARRVHLGPKTSPHHIEVNYLSRRWSRLSGSVVPGQRENRSTDRDEGWMLRLAGGQVVALFDEPLPVEARDGGGIP
jgi:hypothetical protein